MNIENMGTISNLTLRITEIPNIFAVIDLDGKTLCFLTEDEAMRLFSDEFLIP